MRKIKTAVLGTGFMGRVHTEGISRVGNVEVVAIAASNDEKAKKFAAQVGVERSTGDYRTLLKDKEIEAVHVCTPNALHFPMAKAALEAGKHVLCEKPLATSAAEAEEMAKLARANNLANCVFHHRRYYPMVRQLRRMRAAHSPSARFPRAVKTGWPSKCTEPRVQAHGIRRSPTSYGWASAIVPTSSSSKTRRS